MESIEKFLYTWQDDFLEDLDINEKNNLTYACYERIINYFIEYATIKNQVNLIEQIDHRFINQFLKYREDEATRLKDKTKGFEYKTKMLYKTVLKLSDSQNSLDKSLAILNYLEYLRIKGCFYASFSCIRDDGYFTNSLLIKSYARELIQLGYYILFLLHVLILYICFCFVDWY